MNMYKNNALLSLFLFVTTGVLSVSQACGSTVPMTVRQALEEKGIAPESLSLSVRLLYGTDGSEKLAWQSDVMRRPASVMKIVTTAAALDLLGPGKTWKTVFLIPEEISGGKTPSLVIRAGGAPYFPASEMRTALSELNAAGVRAVAGDIWIDGSVFAEPHADPAAFDGAASRPYNQGHDALGLGMQSVVLTFIPKADGTAAIAADPRPEGYELPDSVPMSAESCPSNRASVLKPEYADTGMLFRGSYPESCGKSVWSFVPWQGKEDALRYDGAVIRSMWKTAGGEWTGKIRSGMPEGNFRQVLETESNPLSVLVADINKQSINPIARNLFLALSADTGAATLKRSRAAVSEWMRSHLIDDSGFFIDNGSGLSRTSRISVSQLSAVLNLAGSAGWGPEFIASLPIAGVDGTMRRRSLSGGSAHIKTGYIQGVRSVAGYVLSRGGRWYSVAGIVNDAKALSSGSVLDAFLEAVASEEF